MTKLISITDNRMSVLAQDSKVVEYTPEEKGVSLKKNH